MTKLPALPSRGLRGILGGVLAGAVSALILRYSLEPPTTYALALVHFSMVLIAMVPLFIAGLGAGVWSGIAAAAVGIGIMFAADMQAAFGYAIFCAVPVALTIVLSLHRHADGKGKVVWFGEGSLISILALYAGVVFILIALSFPRPGGMLDATTRLINAQITDSLKEIDGMANNNDAADLKDMPDVRGEIANFHKKIADLRPLVPLVAKTLPAIVGISWVFFMLLSMIVAQSTLKQQNWQLRPNLALRNIVAPDWLIFAVAATGLAAVFAPAPFNYMSTNMCIMFCLPFFFTGLAVFHVWTSTLKARWLLLIIYYLLLSLPWTMTPVVTMTLLAGIADHWINFRERLASPGSKWKKGGKI